MFVYFVWGVRGENCVCVCGGVLLKLFTNTSVAKPKFLFIGIQKISLDSEHWCRKMVCEVICLIVGELLSNYERYYCREKTSESFPQIRWPRTPQNIVGETEGRLLKLDGFILINGMLYFVTLSTLTDKVRNKSKENLIWL